MCCRNAFGKKGLRNAISLAECITAKMACHTPSKVIGQVEVGTQCSLPLADKSVGCCFRPGSESRSVQTTETVDQSSYTSASRPSVSPSTASGDQSQQGHLSEDHLCDYEAGKLLRLEPRARVHNGERLFKCALCPKSFFKKDHLKRHLCVHTGERPFQCPLCLQNFTRKANLETHLRIHTGEKPWQCPTCPQRFSHKSSMKDHLRTHTAFTDVCCANEDLACLCTFDNKQPQVPIAAGRLSPEFEVSTLVTLTPKGLTNAVNLDGSITTKMACHAPSKVIGQVEVGTQCSLPLTDKSVGCSFKAGSESRSVQTIETVDQSSSSSASRPSVSPSAANGDNSQQGCLRQDHLPDCEAGFTNAMSLAEIITAKTACHAPSIVIGQVEVGTQCRFPLADKSVDCSFRADSESRSVQTTETVDQSSATSAATNGADTTFVIRLQLGKNFEVRQILETDDEKEGQHYQASAK
nr:zinc finger protein 467-like isoform X4 [Dermacentor andersoni]